MRGAYDDNDNKNKRKITKTERDKKRKNTYLSHENIVRQQQQKQTCIYINR